MERFPILPGNGQEIYIDPETLNIVQEWRNQELNAIVMPDISINQANPVYEAYKEMFEDLFDKGYKIVTDSRAVRDDAFFFTPCLDEHINKTKEDYNTKKSNKIYYCLKNEGIEEPFSISFPVDSFPNTLPPLPFVLKNEDSQGGEEKFILRTPDQVETLKKFYNEINSYDKQKRIEAVKRSWSHLEGLEFDETGHPNMKGPLITFSDYKKKFHQNMRLQKYVKTPTEYNTSLRVLVASSGDVLAASLKYADSSLNVYKKYYGDFDKYLSDSASPYFLGNESIISNTLAGGSSILLGKDNYSKLEQEILLAHGINPSNANVPYDVMRACISVATNCSREIGAICGLDFIYDVEEKSWKYLEEHEYPMLYSYAEKYNLPYDFDADNFYIVDKLIDMRVRLHALALTMQKKQLLISKRQK